MTGITARNLDGPIPLALALLDQRWPTVPAVDDAAGQAAMATLGADPRYLVGRLQQAITVLLADDLSAMDPHTLLLSQALADAIAWRHDQCRPCHCAETQGEACAANCDQADRYHGLALMLGAVGDLPSS
jgi:hypothetical protein